MSCPHMSLSQWSWWKMFGNGRTRKRGGLCLPEASGSWKGLESGAAIGSVVAHPHLHSIRTLSLVVSFLVIYMHYVYEVCIIQKYFLICFLETRLYQSNQKRLSIRCEGWSLVQFSVCISCRLSPSLLLSPKLEIW